MDLDNLTAKTVESTLKAWRQNRPLPPELLNLASLGASHTATSTERGELLWKRLERLVTEALANSRQQAELPAHPHPVPSRAALKAALKSDFSQGQTEVEAWSAVYHTYLVPPENRLSVAELAAAALANKTANRDKPRQFRRSVQAGLIRLAAALQKDERQARHRPRELPLPIPDYSELFGAEPVLAQLSAWLLAAEGPRLIGLEALGGSGKTALAREMAGRMLNHPAKQFAEILWVSARQEDLLMDGRIVPQADAARSTDDIITRLADKIMPGQLAGMARADKLARLAPLLTTQPYLIIIDNLETVSDIQELLPTLFALKGATRFLLTSRVTLQSFAYVQSWHVTDLSRQDSYRLLDSELRRRARQSDLTEAQLDEIYQTVGGVPLALKLVAAQLQKLGLPKILEGLRVARQKAPEAMYAFIYQRIWHLLTEPARLLLLALQPINPEGEDVAFLQEVSTLPEAEFTAALGELRDYALLEVTGSLATPLYHLHRLTITFLQTKVLLGWDDAVE